MRLALPQIVAYLLYAEVASPLSVSTSAKSPKMDQHVRLRSRSQAQRSTAREHTAVVLQES